MLNFTHCVPTKFVFGRGAENEVGKYLRELGVKKALIHYGGGSAVRSGLIGRVEQSLDAAGIAELMPYPRYRIECEYAHYDIIRAFLKNIEHEQGQSEFGAKISFDILLPESEAERMQEGLRGRTSGQVKITLLGVEQVPVKIR